MYSIREELIVEELSNMCDELLSNEAQVEQGLQTALDKYERMVKSIGGEQSQKMIRGNYIKYVLNEGTQFEKTRLVRNVDAQLTLHNRQLVKA